jgi:hypothetical protein
MGLACAERLADTVDALLLVDLDESSVTAAAKSLAASAGQASVVEPFVLDVTDGDALEAAYAAMPPGECSVERMAPITDGVELIVGVRRDPRFGPVLLVGLGGVYAEIFRDVAVALAPVEPDEAEELLRSLRSAPLLTGARGRRPADVAAAARAASALSQLGARAPWLAEVEINPLLVTLDGACGLDARLVFRPVEERR